MDFCWVTLRVRDMERSLHFYRDLLELPVTHRSKEKNGTEIAMLGDADKPKIELLCEPNVKPAYDNSGLSVGFAVESAEKTRDFLIGRHVEPITGMIAPTPNIVFFFVHDPDGVTVQFVENK